MHTGVAHKMEINKVEIARFSPRGANSGGRLLLGDEIEQALGRANAKKLPNILIKNIARRRAHLLSHTERLR